MKSRFSVMFLIVSLTLLSACGAQPASTTQTGTIPEDLQTLEEAAEDIIDFAPSGNWDRITTDVTDMQAAWNAYQPLAVEAGVPKEMQGAMTSALAELQTAASSKDATATMQASNDVSAAVIEMFALYNPRIPADIGRLDVLERQVILDVAAQDFSAAEATLAKAQAAWERVKESALSHDGKEVADQFEASLAVQASALAAQDAAALTEEAKAALEIVDLLERLF